MTPRADLECCDHRYGAKHQEHFDLKHDVGEFAARLAQGIAEHGHHGVSYAASKAEACAVLADAGALATVAAIAAATATLRPTMSLYAMSMNPWLSFRVAVVIPSGGCHSERRLSFRAEAEGRSRGIERFPDRGLSTTPSLDSSTHVVRSE